ncbi:hypothetical protein BMS3Bbin12_02209 [bacterium BMS3Bbin12]|nr:hypothetical protein BMS3Abin12_00404 [bacterium BMS3Abin12]GBE49016.1 hypothetical protein BMS3Bbin12_02209 [bacterium BMS3Bbin12]GBE49428.1 hypothetical protein BMS3Bbin13_00347 [bacterium BMS3Bbin13]
MGRLRILVALAVTLVLGVPAAGADTFLLKAIRQAPPNGPAGIPRPTRGMTMASVLKHYGTPAKKLAAVGKPPITRWAYKKYTVYFEDRYVIDSVVRYPNPPRSP